MSPHKLSRLGFVIIKLSLDGLSYYLMRKDVKWKDFNFIGGHQDAKDRGSLELAARRELWEEVPTSRHVEFSIEPLTDPLDHGPVLSKSAGIMVKYEVQFFLLKLAGDPVDLLSGISKKSMNRLICESELLSSAPTITKMVGVLNKNFDGGLQAIPFSCQSITLNASVSAGVVEFEQYDLLNFT